MSSYITSQFNHCPLVWMTHNKKLKKKISKVLERALRIVYGDHKTKFSELFNIDKSITIHQRNLQYLLIEIYKVKKSISPTIMNEVFQFFENPVYELTSGVHVPNRNSRVVFFSTESIMNLGAKLWNMVPQNIKSSESLNVFKSKIKYWIPNHCPCRIFKIYIGQVFVFVESTICLTYLFLTINFLKNYLKLLLKYLIQLYLTFIYLLYHIGDCTI